MNTPKVKIEGAYYAHLQMLVSTFWDNGGKEKYLESKEMREANGIPDKQWFAANLMGIVDDSEITYEPD